MMMWLSLRPLTVSIARHCLQLITVRSRSIIPKCPPPGTDTGCTYCQTPFERDLSKPLAQSQPYVDRYVIHLNHKYESMDEIPSRVGLPLLKTVRESPQSIQCTLGIIKGEKHTALEEEMVVRFYPEGIIARGSSESISLYLKSESSVTSLDNKDVNKPLVMVCGHTKRDERCGLIAPILVNEFEQAAKLYNADFDIGYISHVGGHVYAGNVIIFRKGQHPIWYGHVEAHHVQGIVQESILDDNIIDELYRGRYNGTETKVEPETET